MNAVFFCKSNGVQQAVILKNHIRVVPSAVTSAPLTFSVLNLPVSQENRRRRSLDPLYHKHSLQQLSLLTLIVYVNLPPRGDLEVCVIITGNNEKVSP